MFTALWSLEPQVRDLNAFDPDHLGEFPDNVRQELLNMTRKIWEYEVDVMNQLESEETRQREILAQKQYVRAQALGEKRTKMLDKIQAIKMDTVQQLKQKERAWNVAVAGYIEKVNQKIEAKRREEEAKRRKDEEMITRGKRKK